MRHIVIIAIACMLSGSVHAQEGVKELTNEEALNVLSGLEQLDSYEKVIKENDKEKSVRVFYKFGATVRLMIGRDISALRVAKQNVSYALQALQGELREDDKSDQAARLVRMRQEQKKLAEHSSGVRPVHIKAVELNLDENPIP